MPFSWARVEELITLYDHIGTRNLTIDDVKDYKTYMDKEMMEQAKRTKVETDKLSATMVEQQRKAKEDWLKVAPPCPECGEHLYPPQGISAKKGKANIFGWTCRWECSSPECLYEKFSHESVGTIMESLLKGSI